MTLMTILQSISEEFELRPFKLKCQTQNTSLILHEKGSLDDRKQ